MEPLVFEPYLRPQIWGGRRLGERFGKVLPGPGPFGESWEISAHPHHVSRVAEGPLRGASLNEICARHGPDLFGFPRPADRRFPLLIKLLDCQELLSIQVHPTDELAAKLRNEWGKTEAWIVLEAQPSARIFAGLLPGTTPELLQRCLNDHAAEKCLHSFHPKAGDCIFLPAGAVHAVGGGVVLAEVQQTSDATFRLYDWNRLGSDGKPRQLHLKEALASIDWSGGPLQPTPGVPLAGLSEGVRATRLVECRYFTMDRVQLEKPFSITTAPEIWMVLDGTATLLAGDGTYRRRFQRGETVLLPATAQALRWEPVRTPATLLSVRWPRTD
jgi:mannose-6-phosphate isomerase